MFNFTTLCLVDLPQQASDSSCAGVHQSCPCRGGAERDPCSREEGGEKKDIDTYTYPVVVSAVDVPGHAEVSDLYQQVLAHQAVSVR